MYTQYLAHTYESALDEMRYNHYVRWRYSLKNNKSSFTEFIKFFDDNWLKACLAEWEKSTGLDPYKYFNEAIDDIFPKLHKEYIPTANNNFCEEPVHEPKKTIVIHRMDRLEKGAKIPLFDESPPFDNKYIDQIQSFLDFSNFIRFVQVHYEQEHAWGGAEAMHVIAANSKSEVEAVNKFFELLEEFETEKIEFAKYVCEYYGEVWTTEMNNAYKIVSNNCNTRAKADYICAKLQNDFWTLTGKRYVLNNLENFLVPEIRIEQDNECE